MPVTRHGRQQRKSGGMATKPQAQRIAVNVAKLPELLKKDKLRVNTVAEKGEAF